MTLCFPAQLIIDFILGNTYFKDFCNYHFLTFSGMNPGGGMSSNAMSSSQRPQNMDIKLLHAKKQQAEMRINQKEEDLRENHPYFDRPLFAVPRESKFRRICQAVVNAR